MVKRRSNAEKQNIIKAVEQALENSDLTVKEACAAHEISDGSFYIWRKQLDMEKESVDAYEEDDAAERAVVQMKRDFPFYGVVKICKQLQRFNGMKVHPGRCARILERHGLYGANQGKPRRKKGSRRFERLEANELWMMDIMYYRLKKAGRFYLVSVLDDCSRFVCAHRVCTIQKAENVIATFKQAVENHGAPEEVLTDRGSQFHSWKGISKFDVTLDKLQIKHIVASAQSPQTIGKIESWHRNLQRELLRQKEFEQIEEVKKAIDEYVEYYNHERVHMGIDYVTPADRYFGVDKDVEKVMLSDIEPDQFYLTARIEGQPIRAEQTEDGKAVVKLAGKPIKELEVEAIKELFV